MANLPESSTFEPGIYQIETTDEVLGGVNGVSNTQGKQLANRTTWLKAQVDALLGQIGKSIPAFNQTLPYEAGEIVGHLKTIWRANTNIAADNPFNASQWTDLLGTAARENATTSSLDSTSGRMLRVGDFGLAARLTNESEPDLNNYRSSGFFLTPAVGLVNLPIGWAQSRCELIVSGNSGSSYCGMQLISGSAGNADRMAWRDGDGAGGWRGWKEFWHSGSLVKTSSPTDTTAGRVLLVDHAEGRYADKSANLSDLANAATAFGNIKQAATESATGVVERSTQAEAEGFSDNSRYLSPLRGKQLFDAAISSGAAPAVSGFTGALLTYMHDDGGVSNNGFLVDSNLTEATFESVGPTGSSATNIWTDMDSIPAGAKIVTLGVKMQSSTSGSGSANVNFRCYAKRTGSTEGLSDITTIAKVQFYASGSAQTFGTYEVVDVPLDENGRFSVAWAGGGGSIDETIKLIVKGYKI